MNAALRQICSCTWDHGAAVIIRRDPLCAVHDESAEARRIRMLKGEREGAARAVREHRVEALTWFRRYRRSKQRLADLNKQLKEIGHV